MSRDRLIEASAVAGDNTDIGGNSIAEGAPSSAWNDALRELYAQAGRAFVTGADPILDVMTLADPADNSRRVRFDAGNVSAGATRVLSAPNTNGTILTAETAAASFLAILTNVAQPGQFQAIGGGLGTALVLPSGGTWAAAWFGYRVSTLTIHAAFSTQIAAGGTELAVATPDVAWTGFAVRLT